jgi:sugar phosphate isomerase/epimerase
MSPMIWKTFAMDTAFSNSLGTYPLATRVPMLKSLGYDACYYLLWNAAECDELAQLAAVCEAEQLPCAGVWVYMSLSHAQRPRNDDAIARAMTLIPRGSALELTIGSAAEPGLSYSDPAGDSGVLRVLESLLRVADERGIDIVLYPHINCWMERHDDALRLCDALRHPRLGLAFCAWHWYALKPRDLAPQLARLAGHLRSVNCCGSRPVRDALPTIEPVDDGELDSFTLLKLLHRLGYRGYVGVQGYSAGGDAYAKLRRSLAALHDIQARLQRHPEWSGAAS